MPDSSCMEPLSLSRRFFSARFRASRPFLWKEKNGNEKSISHDLNGIDFFFGDCDSFCIYLYWLNMIELRCWTEHRHSTIWFSKQVFNELAKFQHRTSMLERKFVLRNCKNKSSVKNLPLFRNCPLPYWEEKHQQKTMQTLLIWKFINGTDEDDGNDVTTAKR